ncbi:hypothetical protein APH_0458 [Anaplasma phagocytophilum str. HZ]|uniref:Uncharacterized protein n=1 Tax=Anaplasma phagocytophilum (strain HZ) TaxID=212042 RepID=Q2GKP1_ANAPZ|nr:hypothetical protein APH_0458 [Anaplasma phagocytophilum str. HZ]
MIAAISRLHAFTLRYDKGEIIVLRLLRYALKGHLSRSKLEHPATTLSVCNDDEGAV